MWSDLSMRLRSLLRRGKVEDELDDELRFHMEQQKEKYVRGGMSREEAQRRVRLDFGGLEQVKEDCREAHGTTLLTTFTQDVRFALRLLRKSPGFTAAVVSILALGIGANTAVFSIVDAVLLRPLPYKNADRLVVVWQRSPTDKLGIAFDTYREFEEWSRNSRSFEELSAATWARDAGAVLTLNGEKREIFAVPVSVNFFSVLKVPAAQGRTFEKNDLNNSCTVVLSHQFWQQRLRSASDWATKPLTLDGMSCTIAGVMPQDFSFYPKQTDLWRLITPNSRFTQKPWDMPIGAFGLLKPGVSRAAAEAELASIQSQIIHENPGVAAMKMQPNVIDLQWEFTWLTGRSLRQGLILLFAVVVFVLLIACVNVANLLLGRAVERQKELSLRAAIGASRSRLIRQLLTESAVLSLAGACLGILIAYVAVWYVATKEATQLPPGNPLSVNWVVLAFTVVLTLVTSVLFGLVPAWKASRIDLNEALKQSATTASRSASSHRTSYTLVVAEVALSLVVLVAAGLLIQSLVRLTNAPLGYERENLLWTNQIRLPATSYPKAEDWAKFWERIDTQLQILPGLRGAVLASGLDQLPDTGPVTLEGASMSAQHVASSRDSQSVGVGYFQVLGIPLLKGRDFTDTDRPESPAVAIVNEAFARQFIPGGSAIGHRIKLGTPEAKLPWLTIVGVVGNVSQPTLYLGYDSGPAIYRPLRQDPISGLSVYIRTEARISGIAPEINRAIATVDNNLPMPALQTASQSLAEFTSEPRFRAQLFGIFGGLALLLAAVGIYGVLAQLVVQRTQEIGIRIAVGADRGDVLRLIMGKGLKIVSLGIAIGIVGALLLTRLLSSMLYGIGTTDPSTFVGVSLLLALVAVFACYIPARRAMRTDPLASLRCE